MSHLSRASREASLALQAQIIQVVAENPGISVLALAALLDRTAQGTGSIIGWMVRKGQITIIRPEAHHQPTTLYPYGGSAGPYHVRRPESLSGNSERSPAHAITDADRAWMAYWKARYDARIARAAQENHP